MDYLVKIYKEIQNIYQETHGGKIDKLASLCFIKYIMDPFDNYEPWKDIEYKK